MTTIEIEGNVDDYSEEAIEDSKSERKPKSKKVIIPAIEHPFDPEFKKTPSKLTKMEKEAVLSNIKSGKSYKHFELDESGDKIVKKKEPTLRTMGLSNTKSKNTDPSKVYLTDNQLLFEHIIKMNRAIEKMKQKQKKYKTRLNDIVYREPVEEVEEIDDGPLKEPEKESKREKVEEPETETVERIQFRTSKRPSFRDGIKYLP
jgi:hypothetical protein